MNERYRLFLRRKSVYYAFDNTTKTFQSLKTHDRAEGGRGIFKNHHLRVLASDHVFDLLDSPGILVSFDRLHAPMNKHFVSFKYGVAETFGRRCDGQYARVFGESFVHGGLRCWRRKISKNLTFSGSPLIGFPTT